MKAVYSRSRRRRAPVKAVEVVPPKPTIWDKPLWADKQCARPAIPDAKNPLFHRACVETFPHNANQTYCSQACRCEVVKKYDRDSYRTANPVKIKQCARPGCGKTFPDRMGGPIYCANCRKLVLQAIKRKTELKNRERNRPKRAAQMRGYRAAWSKEKREEFNKRQLERYYEKRKAIPKKVRPRLPPEEAKARKRKSFRKYYAANQEKMRARSRAYYRANVEANRDEINARARKYLAANRETINAQRRARAKLLRG